VRRSTARNQCNSLSSACQACQAPSTEKNDHTQAKNTGIWTHRASREQIDEQQPHTDELSQAATVISDLHLPAFVT
jgi:hypothetical protein